MAVLADPATAEVVYRDAWAAMALTVVRPDMPAPARRVQVQGVGRILHRGGIDSARAGDLARGMADAPDDVDGAILVAGIAWAAAR